MIFLGNNIGLETPEQGDEILETDKCSTTYSSEELREKFIQEVGMICDGYTETVDDGHKLDNSEVHKNYF